jgi:ABC-type amino acid transport substrate-binding protein
MIASDFPDIFAQYVHEVVNRLGQKVNYWVTINEPNQLIWGYIKPYWRGDYDTPPGQPLDVGYGDQICDVGKLMRNLFIANSRAYKIITDANADAKVGANPYIVGLPTWLRILINKNAEIMARRMKGPGDLKKQRHARLFVEGRAYDRGKVDVVMATLTRTPERERQVMFSDVYFLARQQLLVKSDSKFITAKDLSEKVVVVVKGSTSELDFVNFLPESQVRVASDQPNALQQLVQEDVHALLGDNMILRGLMNQYPKEYRLMDLELKTQIEPYAAAVTQGNGKLLEVINKAIRQFKDSGELESSYEKHVSTTVPAVPGGAAGALPLGRSTLPQETSPSRDSRGKAQMLAPKGTGLRRIQERGYLKVAVKSDVPGLSFQGPNGEFSGLEIDLARAIAEQIFGDPNKVRFYSTITNKRISSLRSSRRFLDALIKIYCIVSTFSAYSDWWYLGMAGKLPEFICPKDCCHKQDYVGLDYYWGIREFELNRIQALIDAGLGDFSHAPVWSRALYNYLRYLADLFPEKPIIILENGCVDQADILRSPISRERYLNQHIHEIQRAVRDGVKVTMYLYWAITTNREWGHAFGPKTDYGLYHIRLNAEKTDPDFQKRVPIEAADTYRDIIANRGEIKLDLEKSQQ